MNENPYLEQILTELNAVGKNWDELLSGKFRLQELFDLVGSMAKAAESIFTAPQSGIDKHRVVREAFDYFDQKYHIIDRVDDLIALPIFLEPFDGPFLRKVVDFLIGQAVAVFNASIWKEQPSASINAVDLPTATP